MGTPDEGTTGRGRAYRREQNEKKQKRRWKIVGLSHYYNPAAGYVKRDFVDGSIRVVGTHIQYPKNSNEQRFLKQQSNRKVRRYQGELPKGNTYRKMFDYWFNLW